MKTSMPIPRFIRLWPLFELAAIVGLSFLIGFGKTMLIILGTSVAGFIVLKKFSPLKKGQNFNDPMAMMSIMAKPQMLIFGFLLLIPGILSSILAVLCLFPFILRRIMNRAMRAAMQSAMGPGGMQGNPFAGAAAKPANNNKPIDDNVIEGEVFKSDDKSKK